MDENFNLACALECFVNPVSPSLHRPVEVGRGAFECQAHTQFWSMVEEVMSTVLDQMMAGTHP